MANADAFSNSTSICTDSLPTARPTSKDYASEIHRLEMERVKLQTQPLLSQQARNTTSTSATVGTNAAGSRSDETLLYSTSKKQELQSQKLSHIIQPLASRSIPEIRFNLDSIKAEMQRNKQVVNSIQNQLSNRSEELNGVRSQLLKEQRDSVSLAHQRDLYSGDASEEHRMITQLRAQLDHQARENAILKQQVFPTSASVLSHTPSESRTRSEDDKTIPVTSQVTLTHQNAPPVVVPSQLAPSDNTVPSPSQLAKSSALPLAQSSQPKPTSTTRPSSTGTSDLQSPKASSPDSLQSPGGSSPSGLSPHSSFTSVTSAWSSMSTARAERTENSNKVQMFSESIIGPPANVDGQKRSQGDHSNEVHLQKRLEQSEAQIMQLKERLKEGNDNSEQQKIHFRESLRELQTKLTETIVGRDSVLELKKKDAEDRERLIDQLQGTLKELDADYRIQQEVLRDSSFQMDSLQQTHTNTSTVLNQINLLVTKEAEDRGLNLIITASSHHSGLTNQRPALVLTSLKQLLKCCDDELQEARQRAMNSGKELEDLKNESGDYKLKTSEEHRCKLNQLSEDHEKQLSTVTERALNARQQATGLQEQLAVLQDQMQHQMAAKDVHIGDLEQTLVDMQTQMRDNRKVLEEKCKSLDDEMDELTEHSRTVTKERDELVTIVESLEMELAETKDSVTKAETDADAEHEQNKQLEKKREETFNKCNDLMNQVHEKTTEVQELKGLLAQAKDDAEKQVTEHIITAVREERQRSLELTSQLSAQVASLTHKCTVLSQELDQKEDILYTFKKQQDDTLRSTEDREHKLQMTLSEKADLEKTIENMKKEAEVMKQERDHYCGVVDERNKELSSLRSQEEKLSVQVSELEHHTMALREQSANMAHVVEMSSKSSNEAKEEKASLQQLLQERIAETERLKITTEDVERRLKLKERKAEEVETENKRLMEEVEVKMKDIEDVIESKEKMLTELREAKLEVDAIAKDNERLRVDAVQCRRQADKERNRLTSKLHAVEHELAVTTKAIQTTCSMDVKAVRVAENMQKKVTAKRGQIDTLQSKINWLNECLDATLKEKSTVIGEKDMLQLKVERLTKHNERLTAEQVTIVHKRKAQKSVVKKLESAIEKAALKHSEMQAYVEMHEQDMARMKLKHQLEIKEVQRSAASAIPSTTARTSSAITKPVPPTSHIPAAPVAQITNTKAVQTHDNISSETSTEKRHGDKDYHGLQLLIQESSPNRVSGEVINDELKALLSEMKNVLHTAANDGASKQHDPPHLLNSRNSRMSHDMRTYAKGLDPPIHASSPYKDITTPSTPYKDITTPGTPPTSHMQYRTHLGPLTGYTSNEMTIDGPPSPVANLLGKYDDREQPEGGSTTPGMESGEGAKGSHATSREMISAYHTVTKRRDSGANTQMAEMESEDNISRTGLTTTESDLDDSMQKQRRHIEEMEEQLKALAKIGGQLQYENKEMATLIKSQNVKLKRCRKEEEDCMKTMGSKTKHR